MLSIGIVGLPNAGKSTLFNALLKSYQAKVAEHPFTTIDPNVGVVEVPDDTLSLVVSRLSLAKKIPATIQFIDIAGLVKGAHQGEGLGNQFLSHIRESNAILHLINFFDPVADPESDLETIKTELNLKDLEMVQKALKDKDINPKRQVILEKVNKALGQDKPAAEAKLTEDEKSLVADLNLLTLKSVLYVANVSEEQLEKPLPPFFPKETLAICAKTESDLIELDEKEQKEYLESLGLFQSGLDKIIQAAYKTLGLITFYTLKDPSTLQQTSESPRDTRGATGSGQGQIQAWSIRKGSTAPDAAGEIHTDFAKKFVHAEVCPAKELIKFRSFHEAKEKGKVRTEGKNYLISNQDVVYFKHR